MNKLTNWLELHFVPFAAKLGSQKHLCAIRDSFIASMPVTMAGSISVLLNVFLRDLPTTWGMTEFVEKMSPLIELNALIYWGTISIIALIFAFSLGYNISSIYNINPVAGGIISFAALIITTPQTDSAGNFGYLNVLVYGGATGIFTALFVGILATLIYVFITKKNIVIKLPDSVPPAVNKAFAAIIPGLISMYSIGILTYFINKFAGTTINGLIFDYIQKPLVGLSQGLISVIIISFLIQLFWFFGLHGHNVLGPLLDGVYATALAENMAKFQQTNDVMNLPWVWTRGSFDAFSQMGGSGVTIGLIIAIFIASKRKDQLEIAKLAAPMSIFNINEPVTFGIPIVLNPIYAIPWLIIPPICVTIAYLFTSAGIIPPVFVSVPWIVPPGIYAFLATGGSFLAAAVSILNLIIAILIWLPFVKLANKTE